MSVWCHPALLGLGVLLLASPVPAQTSGMDDDRARQIEALNALIISVEQDLQEARDLQLIAPTPETGAQIEQLEQVRDDFERARQLLSERREDGGE